MGFFFPKKGQLQIQLCICLFLAHRAYNHNSKTGSNLQKQWILLSKLQLMFYFMQQCIGMSRTFKRNYLSQLFWKWISLWWFQTLYFKFFDLWWKRWLFWWIWWKAAMQWYVQMCLFWYIYTFERKISQITFIHVACLAPDHLCGDSTTCIVSNKICDGIMDCQDNSDEFNCSMFVFFI